MNETMRVDMIMACIMASRVKSIHLGGVNEHGEPVDETNDSPAYTEARVNAIARFPGVVLDLTMTVVFKDRSVGVWKLTKF